MRILFFSTAHNSLSQRAYVELTYLGNNVYVQIANNEEAMIDLVKLKVLIIQLMNPGEI